MSRAFRWCIAGLVTTAAFAVTTWLAGSFVLATVLKSRPDRWVVAVGAGAAVAALAGLWGHSWATQEEATTAVGEDSAEVGAGKGAHAPGSRSVAAGGDVSGIVSTGDDATNVQL